MVTHQKREQLRGELLAILGDRVVAYLVISSECTAETSNVTHKFVAFDILHQFRWIARGEFGILDVFGQFHSIVIAHILQISHVLQRMWSDRCQYLPFVFLFASSLWISDRVNQKVIQFSNNIGSRLQAKRAFFR